MVNSQENIVDLAKLNEEFFDDEGDENESNEYFLWWKKRHYVEHHEFVKKIKNNSEQNEDVSFLLRYKRKLKGVRVHFYIFTLIQLIELIAFVSYSYSHHLIYSFWPNRMFASNQLQEQAAVISLICLILIFLDSFLARLVLHKDHVVAKKKFMKLDSELYNPFFYKNLGFKIFSLQKNFSWYGLFVADATLTSLTPQMRKDIRAIEKHREKLSLNPKFIFHPFNFRLIKTPKLYFKSPIDFGIDAAIWMIANNIKR